MSKLSFFLIFFSVVVICIGQMMFKYSAVSLKFSSDMTVIQIIEQNIKPLIVVISALILYFIATIAWIYALRSTPLSFAFMMNALAFIIVPAAGFLLFGETMPRNYLAGTVLIISGIVVLGLQH